MWIYEKRLQFPVDVKKRDLKLAKQIYDTLGGPSGELSASMEYLQQRYTMPTSDSIALLTDIGTEELGHLEMLSSLVFQLTDGATVEEVKDAGFESTYVGSGGGIALVNPDGNFWNAGYISVTADPIGDLTSNLAAEERARVGYDHLLTLTTDDEVRKVLSFLREREIVHFQRFGEMLGKIQERRNF